MTTRVTVETTPEAIPSSRIRHLEDDIIYTFPSAVFLGIEGWRKYNAQQQPDPTKDALTFVFDGAAPTAEQLSASIAAFPTLVQLGSGQSIAVQANQNSLLYECPVPVGASLAFDVFIHASMGAADNFTSGTLRGFPVVSRRSSGSVRCRAFTTIVDGDLPGPSIVAETTATTVKFLLRLNGTGTVQLITVSVSRPSSGVVS